MGTSPAYSFSAAVCEVDVDMETGKVRVLNFWDAHDCGTAINPLAVEGQVEGAVVMGLSETLLENQVFDEKGTAINADLHNYMMATSTMSLLSTHPSSTATSRKARLAPRKSEKEQPFQCSEPSPTLWPTPSGLESTIFPSHRRKY